MRPAGARLCVSRARDRTRDWSFIVIFMLAAGGCESMQLDPVPPANFDLSGTWLLVPDVSDPPPRQRDLRARDLSMSFAAQDFPVLAAKTMQIEQNRDSMGVRYDGGDYRDISWGHRKRGLWEVHSGWKDGDLYIISKAHDATATEIIQLSDSRREIAVQIEIKSGDTMTFYRVFERGAGTF